MQFYSYRLAVQNTFSAIHYAGKLFQQYVVDAYGTDLTQCRTCEWHVLESNLLSTKISSIYHRVWVDALVRYTRRKHSQQALTEYIISNS